MNNSDFGVSTNNYITPDNKIFIVTRGQIDNILTKNIFINYYHYNHDDYGRVHKM